MSIKKANEIKKQNVEKEMYGRVLAKNEYIMVDESGNYEIRNKKILYLSQKNGYYNLLLIKGTIKPVKSYVTIFWKKQNF